MNNITVSLPGVFANYKKKNCIDIWVAAKMIKAGAMTKLLMSDDAGTMTSLKLLYNITTATDSELNSLLHHLYFQLRSSPAFGGQSESLCSVGITLCGWHRHKTTCSWRGKTVTLLHRAIVQEEEECQAAMQEANEMGIDLYVPKWLCEMYLQHTYYKIT